MNMVRCRKRYLNMILGSVSKIIGMKSTVSKKLRLKFNYWIFGNHYLDVTVVMSCICLTAVNNNSHQFVRVMQVRIVSGEWAREWDFAIGQRCVSTTGWGWRRLLLRDSCSDGCSWNRVGLCALDALGSIRAHVDGPGELNGRQIIKMSKNSINEIQL